MRVELSLSLTQAFRDARLAKSGRTDSCHGDNTKAFGVFVNPFEPAVVSPSLSGGPNQVYVEREGAERTKDVGDTGRVNNQTCSPIAPRDSLLPPRVPPTSEIGSPPSVNTRAVEHIPDVDASWESSENSTPPTPRSRSDADAGGATDSEFDSEEPIILDYWHNSALTAL